MPKMFISYRRDDSQWPADQLYRVLKAYVDDPDKDIFIDVDSMPLGIDFSAHLRSQVLQCDYVLALIGPGWLNVVDRRTGKRRLEDPNDFVRVELATALASGIKVVPILLDGAAFPEERDLPEDLAKLAKRAGVEVRRLSFDSDVNRLIEGLGLWRRDIAASNRKPEVLRLAGSRWAMAAGAVAVALVAAFGVMSLTGPSTPAEQSERAYRKLPADDPAAYREFLRLFSGTPEAEQVSIRLKKLDDSFWEAATEEKTLTAFENYLTAFPMDAQPPGAHLSTALRFADNSRRIADLQRELIAKGFLVGEANGKLDSFVNRAVRLFGSVSGQEFPELEPSSLESVFEIRTALEKWDESIVGKSGVALVPVGSEDECRNSFSELTIYFEYDRIELTSSNAELIEEHVKRPLDLGCRISSVHLSSPTSEARIYTVKAKMIELGVPEEVIKTEFDRGRLLALGPTTEREPLSRRVEATIMANR